MKRVGVAVVGVRNFAGVYLENIKKLEAEGMIKLTGVVVSNKLKNKEKVRKLRAKGIDIYDSYNQLLKNGHDFVDIIALPVSISSHTEMAVKGMQKGYNILLEKPPAPTVEQIDKIIDTEKKTGKFCSIGFQFIHSRSIRKLKKHILEGKIGEVKDITCKGYWPRYRSYYERNSWAGKSIYDGKVVLDGPLHNALAHFLNNMIFLAGDELNKSAKLKKVRAELYRGHSYIEAEDTSCLEAVTDTGLKIYFYVTHCSEGNLDPYMEIRGTKGRVVWNFNETTKLFLDNQEDIIFDNEGVEPWLEVLRVAAKKHLGILENLYSTPENSRSFVVAINGSYDSAEKIRAVPSEIIDEFETEDGEYKTVINNIENIMDKAFEKRKLLSDLDVSWARKTKFVDVENYKKFKPFAE